MRIQISFYRFCPHRLYNLPDTIPCIVYLNRHDDSFFFPENFLVIVFHWQIGQRSYRNILPIRIRHIHLVENIPDRMFIFSNDNRNIKVPRIQFSDTDLTDILFQRIQQHILIHFIQRQTFGQDMDYDSFLYGRLIQFQSGHFLIQMVDECINFR